jgi:hypothetical protein
MVPDQYRAIAEVACKLGASDESGGNSCLPGTNRPW